MNKNANAYFAIIFVNIIWGLSFIASKFALQSGFEPFTLALVRFVMSTILLLPITLMREGLPRFTRREWLLLFCSGTAGISLYFLFEYKGLVYTTAGNASLILAAIPVLTMLTSAVRARTRYGAKVWAGVLVSLGGVYLVVLYGTNPDAPNALLGNVLMLFACACWVAYIELTSSLSARHNSLTLACYQGVLGALTLVPLTLTEQTNLSAISAQGWLSAVFLGVLCSAVCYILYGYAIRKLQPLRTSLFINLNPLSAVIGGVLLLDERVNAVQLVGDVLILLSIVYVNVKLSKRASIQNRPIDKEA